MVDYIRAEFYKLFHRRYFYLALLFLFGCAALLVAGWAFTNSNGNTVDFNSGGSMAILLLSVGLYAPVIVGDLVFSEQYKANTMKNEGSFGLPRSRIYLGKLLVSVIVGVVAAVAVLAFYELLCWLFLLPSAPGEVEQVLRMVGYGILVALPQWLGMLAGNMMLSVLLRSTTLAAFLSIGVIVLPQTLFKLLGLLINDVFAKAAEWMPTAIVEAVQSHMFDWSFLAGSVIAGAVWFVAATAVGLAVFQRREIS